MRTFTVGTTQFRIRVTHGQIRAHMETMADDAEAWADVYRSITPGVLLDAREADVRKQAAKKPRKPTVSAGTRRYPRGGESMSAHDYVREYYRLNMTREKWLGGAYGSLYGYGAGERESDALVRAFFQPLATRITPI